MGEGSASRSRSAGTPVPGQSSTHVAVPDRRPGDRSLRVSWHPHTSTVVFSHWVEGLCVASTQVTVRDTEAVLRFLAASLPVETPTEAQGRLPRSTVGMEEVWEQASGPAAERRSEQA